ncbi:MAG: hypothetical protein JWP20_2132 [Roseomonas sp.]|nr:hypothetical protein [Roseomonas sp.]
MGFIDDILIRLSGEAGRDALLDQQALAQAASAGFDDALDPLEGPYALSLDSVQIGVELAPSIALEGTLRHPDQAVPSEIRLLLRGLRIGTPLRADALWRGQLVARRVPRDSVVEAALPAFVTLELDRAIAAAQGGLPADPATLEAARREELLARLRSGMERPSMMDAAVLQNLLDSAGQRDVAGLLAARGGTSLGTLRLRFSAPPAGPAVPVRLPVTIAVMVREEITSLATLLAETRALRDNLARDPEALPQPAPLRRRTQILPLWVLPAATFAAPGWPGADATARRTAAGEFLQRESIALAVAGP